MMNNLIPTLKQDLHIGGDFFGRTIMSSHSGGHDHKEEKLSNRASRLEEELERLIDKRDYFFSEMAPNNAHSLTPTIEKVKAQLVEAEDELEAYLDARDKKEVKSKPKKDISLPKDETLTFKTKY